jgi:hypothetical protein
MTNDVQDEFLVFYFGADPPTSGEILNIAQELYATLKQIEVVVSGPHTSELAKIMAIKSLLKRVPHPVVAQRGEG